MKRTLVSALFVTLVAGCGDSAAPKPPTARPPGGLKDQATFEGDAPTPAAPQVPRTS